MARVTVLTDRLPDDRSWKGPCGWEIIRSLAESQHDVTVYTTENPECINVTHPRLNIARPAKSWSVDKLPKWTQAILVSQPEILHTFALKPSSMWQAASVWPYLDAFCKVLPNLYRVSTMFERHDFSIPSPSAPWHMGSQVWTVFSSGDDSEAHQFFQGRVDLVPLDRFNWDFESTDDPFAGESRETTQALLVPAAVSEWNDRARALARLADFLLQNSEVTAHINGGWGDLSLRERREGWEILMPVADRVRLLQAQSLSRFTDELKKASVIWTEGLSHDTWRVLLVSHLARAMGKETIGPSPHVLAEGSTANFLSRLYTGLFSSRPVC